MSINTLKDFDLNNKTVLMRVDLNVPVQNGTVTNTKRIDIIKPSLDYLIEHNAKVLLCAHRGNPKDGYDENLSIEVILPALKDRWGVNVDFSTNCIGDKAKALAEKLKPGSLGILENTRFHKGEKANDPEFSKALANNADIYINDAFPSAHRAHASTVGVAELLPNGVGLSMQAELDALESALENPNRPVAAIVGGSKISTKAPLIKNLLGKMDKIIVGGAMANTFFLTQGHDVGKSICEPDMVGVIQDILNQAKDNDCEIVLPVDGLMARKFEENAEHRVTSIDDIGADELMLDIGPKSVEKIGDALKTCKTVLWNGPVGAFEIKPFDTGTNGVGKIIMSLTKNNGVKTVAGGGDTVAALVNAGVENGLSYVSTAGGAFLEWMEGKELPGITALKK